MQQLEREKTKTDLDVLIENMFKFVVVPIWNLVSQLTCLHFSQNYVYIYIVRYKIRDTILLVNYKIIHVPHSQKNDLSDKKNYPQKNV